MPSMTNWITRFFCCVFICVSVARAQDAAITVGAVVSQSGMHAELAADYAKALFLWQDEVNAAGGLLGRRVELQLLDDGSDAVKSGTLYKQLIDEKADLLIGPYGSAATLLAASEAERARRVLVNGGGAAGAVHSRGPRYVFQATMPYASYGIGVLELAKEEGAATLFIVARDDPPSREMAESTRDRAVKRQMKVAPIAFYSEQVVDFAPQVALARDAQAEAWIAFGEVREAADMLRTFKRLDYAPRLFFARASAQPKLIALVGQDAERSLGAMEYHARLGTPGNDRFVRAFAKRWSSRPGPAAAEGYAAATVLAEAVRRAGTLDQNKLRDTLARAEIPTVLGRYKVEASGAQAGMQPAVTQILKGRPEVVWPAELETAKRLPYQEWHERWLLK
jgi:branched-chain amino acid transport system substrate-binding protein